MSPAIAKGHGGGGDNPERAGKQNELGAYGNSDEARTSAECVGVSCLRDLCSINDAFDQRPFVAPTIGGVPVFLLSVDGLLTIQNSQVAHGDEDLSAFDRGRPIRP